jgi:hypothetical protein
LTKRGDRLPILSTIRKTRVAKARKSLARQYYNSIRVRLDHHVDHPARQRKHLLDRPSG